jgi:hypothetical protein
MWSVKSPIDYKNILRNVAIVGLLTVNDCRANLVKPSYSVDEGEDVLTNAYVFVPIASIVGFCAVGVCFLLLIVAKVIYASSDQYMLNNRYDLVIYKQVTSKAQVQQKQVNTNSANMHNLTAAAACGFDINMLNNRNTFNSIFNVPQSNGQANGGPNIKSE